ncbi:DNA replication protein [Rosenbergiella epipactidis]|uniref:DNA replication protein n=1 Tax=Rosenbergiella epipactidis TaxID=1544694 RepID=UPI001F4F35F2|nr:DNA replication protein [Rosenbergiella epipactidis]
MSNVAYANFTARKSHNDKPNSVGKGFALLHRKIMETPFYKDAEASHLWVHLLLRANYEPVVIQTDYGDVMCQRGEFLTGRNTLAEETGLTSDRVKSLIRKFKNLGMISTKSTNRFTVIQVVKYDEYQQFSCPADVQQMSKREPVTPTPSGEVCPADVQRLSTDKEYTNKSNTNVLDMSSGDDQSPCKKTKSKPIPYQAILNAYNETVGDRLPNAEKLNPKRRTAIKRMLGELKQPTVQAATAYFETFMDKAGRFYFGDNNRGWRASFDYLLQPDTITKTREGSL